MLGLESRCLWASGHGAPQKMLCIIQGNFAKLIFTATSRKQLGCFHIAAELLKTYFKPQKCSTTHSSAPVRTANIHTERQQTEGASLGTSVCWVNATWPGPKWYPHSHTTSQSQDRAEGVLTQPFWPVTPLKRRILAPGPAVKPLSPRRGAAGRAALRQAAWPFLLPWWQMFLADVSKCVLSTPSLFFRVSFYWLVQAGKSEPKVITFSLFHKVPGPNIF